MSSSSSFNSHNYNENEEYVNDHEDIDMLFEKSLEEHIFDVSGRRRRKRQIMRELVSSSQVGTEGRQRTYIKRNRVDGHRRLYSDYFAENPTYTDQQFRTRFQMRRHVFLRVVKALGDHTPYFQQRYEGSGKPGLSPLQKCTAAIRMFAYGMSADACDDYVCIGKTTSIQCVKNFAECVVSVFGDEYLRRTTEEDLQRLFHVGEIRGFPGTCNDINVLDRSPVFNDIYNGVAPAVGFTVNGNQYNLGYYLTDSIYPPWAIFIRSIRSPQSDKHKLFAQHQEAARKDVERAFGVLQAQFAIIRAPALMWEVSSLGKIMMACIVLHNMIIEDKRDTYGRELNASDYDQVDIRDDSLA